MQNTTGVMDTTAAGRHVLGRRHILGAGVAALAGGAFGSARAAEAAPDPALIAAARKEGILTVYTSMEMEMTVSWSAAFTEAYGVRVKVVRGPGYPLYDRWLNEERVGRHIADVFQLSDPTLLAAAAKQGFVATYTPSADPVIFQHMKQSGLWYAVHVGYMGIGYNKNRVSDEDEAVLQTKGWDALTDPRWKGRCGTTAAGSGGSTYAYNYMFMKTLKDRYGTPFLRKWAANKPDIYISKPPLLDRLAAGQYAIADEAASSDMEQLYLKGAPVRWVYPDPTPTIVTGQIISAHAPHPNAARLYTEWAFSHDGQTAWLKYESGGTIRPDVVDPRETDKQAWFKEAWYKDPKTLYLDYLTDPTFVDPAKPLIAEWNTIFGYGQASQ